MIHFDGEVALITGGSRGIGASVARLFAAAGGTVAITYMGREDAAKEVLKEVERLGQKGIAVRGDVAVWGDVQRIVDDVLRNFGRVDVLVNNAGIWTYGEVDEMSDEVWERTIDVNLKGTFYMCRAVVPHMKQQGGGRIINISSTAGQRGEAFHSHYAASKGGIISFTKSLAVELAPFNILVNSVAPGWVDTDMCKEVFSDPNYKEEVRKSIPLGRIAGPDDIAGPVIFLASHLARHITGEVLNVNGGSVLCG
ncbi:MAG: SDR family NAD(P)-dependent oxidoreductase [Bacteroidota bacterium]